MRNDCSEVVDAFEQKEYYKSGVEEQEWFRQMTVEM